jgi:CheY-like chemotaxis protein
MTWHLPASTGLPPIDNDSSGGRLVGRWCHLGEHQWSFPLGAEVATRLVFDTAATTATSVIVDGALGVTHCPVPADRAIAKRSPMLLAHFPEIGSLAARSKGADAAPANHVLVIEDDEVLRTLYAEILAADGYRATTWATTPSDPGAIAALAPDLILLDLAVGPTRDGGWTFLAQLKAEPVTAAIPVLVCSALIRRTESASEELTARTCGVLAKPFDLDEFLSLFHDCAARGDDLAARRPQATATWNRTRAPPWDDAQEHANA